MRIIAGILKGRALMAPPGFATRPTSDRLREAIFNILEHGDYPLRGARVLDLFAGSGAMGLEALSRGASFALFVDDSAAARAAIRTNIEALALTGATKIYRRDATALGPKPGSAGPAFDLLFIDPPYGKGLAGRALQSALEGHWLTDRALAVIEQETQGALTLPAPFSIADKRRYGGTEILLARRN